MVTFAFRRELILYLLVKVDGHEYEKTGNDPNFETRSAK